MGQIAKNRGNRDRRISLLRSVCILVVVCMLLAEELLVEAKGGHGGGRGGRRGSYGGGGGWGGGGGGIPDWLKIILIVLGVMLMIYVIWACLTACCETDEPDELCER